MTPPTPTSPTTTTNSATTSPGPSAGNWKKTASPALTPCRGEGQPLGYTGYRYDTDSATYFAQAREYQPQTGRFCAQDVVAGNGAVPVTLNRYGYCWGNPVGMVDLDGREAIPWWFEAISPFPVRPIIGSLEWTNEYPTVKDFIAENFSDDAKGTELVLNYAYGDGSNVVIQDDPNWSLYMMSNDMLTMRTGNYLAPIGEKLQFNESKMVDITTSMIIADSKPYSGYMMLYGSNMDAGGYHISGIVSKDTNGVITYDMTYTFNDIMDPNFRYKSDEAGYILLKALRILDGNITMNDYDIHISWSDVTVINPDKSLNTGWLADMKNINVEEELKELNRKIPPKISRGKIAAFEAEKQYYQELRAYMEAHQEYYGCDDD